ncbi:MAG: exodeoxyribonuclease VII small subunit [Chloroflexota bacterium]
MTDNNDESIKKLTFEAAYEALENTVQKLESGNLSMEETLTLYQRGMALAKHCNVTLDQAELTIQTLTPEGELVDFEETF